MKKIILIFVSLIIWGNLIAQKWTNYTATSSKGICNHIINDIVNDNQGNIWFATSGGVSKFNGNTWVTYSTTDGLVDNYVNKIAIDKSNHKWFATNKGVTEFDDTNWITYDTVIYLYYTQVNDIAIDANGNKWFATANGLVKFDGIKWERYKTTVQKGAYELYYEISNFYTVVIDKSGNKLLGSDYGLFKLDENNNLTDVDPKFGRPIKYITFDVNGHIFCGARSYSYSYLYEYDGNNWTAYDTLIGLSSMKVIVSKVIIDSSNNKWFCSNKGLIKYDGINLSTYATRVNLKSDMVFNLNFDKQGYYWVGTDQGVSKYDGASWTNYTPVGCLIDNNINCIYADKRGNIFFGTAYGVSKFDGSNWTTYTINDGLAGNNITSIGVDGDGNEWFVTGKQVSKFDGTNWLTFNSSNGLPSHIVIEGIDFTQFTLGIDRKGKVWLGSNSELITYNDSIWITYKTPYAAPTIAFDNQNNVWFAYFAGQVGGHIMKFDGNKTIDVLGESAYSIAIDTSNNKWFTTRWMSLLKYNDTSFVSYPPPSSYSSSSGQLNEKIVADNKSNIWMTSRGQGVYKFNGKNWSNYSTYNSGLVYNYINAIAVDPNGDKWFGTTNGVSKYEDKIINEIGTEISDANIFLYPNPVSEKAFIVLPESISKSYITIYSINGKQMQYSIQNKHNLIELDMSKYSKGLYLITIVTNNRVITKKIIKQ